jgi:hypothetical protein
MEMDEAVAILIELLQAGRAGKFGYDLYAREGADVAATRLHNDQRNRERAAIELTPVFFDAAWELCRRGIVRPGVRRTGDQAVSDGGYSFTNAGRAALASLDSASVLLAQPGSLAVTLARYGARYGEGFIQRSQEAIKCRNSEAWLACCAMTGAAAESLLLALAIAKTGNEEEVLTSYKQASGRQRVLNLVVAQANAHRRDTLTTFAGIISLWRDEAAHGRATPLGTANADEALRQLLHMCQWVDREWGALTASASQNTTSMS